MDHVQRREPNDHELHERFSLAIAVTAVITNEN